MLTFNKNYFILFVLVFLAETLIALYVDDAFVRPYFGDVLVVILVYCFVKSFVKIAVLPAAVLVLLFAFAVEALQFMNIVEKLGLQDNAMARTVIGTSFSWHDLLCYALGIFTVLLAEKALKRQ